MYDSHNNNNIADILNPDYIDGLPTKKMIVGSFLMFVIFSYLKLLYILVALYLALHYAH
ncbi:uncharacterized protein LOC108600364 [Drosophila busckii]|uniref:uncharacterized protein LOC108600364 n=1 Tax=Drosophila busckii TaxID=30019 RepID=UPI00083F148B|nr:uncharacterized protein LOC108600364 [Drosophila busckii]XP_017843387.1 uncharacterized protein LOC108600364 [Drosophila busckii]